MKTLILLLALFFLAGPAQAQNLHYFEVGTLLEGGGFDWRDSSFVVATADPALLAEIQQELLLPLNERRHVSGQLAPGHGGFNRNADLWFSWHLAPDAWGLADFSIEVCDGRPYNDVEQDTAYWIGTVGSFCPWASYIKREISAPTTVTEPAAGPITLDLAPNPVDAEARFSYTLSASASVRFTIADARGSLTITMILGQQPAGFHTKTIQTAALANGIYYATLDVNNQKETRTFLVMH